MKTALSILTLAFLYLTVFIQNVGAHIQNPDIDAHARVYVPYTPSEVKTLVAESGCEFTIGGHAGGSDDYHEHKANWFGQVHIHPIDGEPDPNGPFYAIKNPVHSIWGSGFWKHSSSPITASKTMAVGECALGDAVSSGRLWTPNTSDEVYGRDQDGDNRLEYCNVGAAPGIFGAQIQELDFDELGEVLRDLIETARMVDPDIDTAIYFGGHIQTLVFDENTVYAYESYSLGVPELVEEYLNDGLRVEANIVELDPLDGVEYEIPAAPPKSRRILTTTWAAMKQK